METKSPKQGKWYMTLLGGIIGLILGLIFPIASILIFNQLYYICLMFIPVIICLFIKLLLGCKNVYSIIYATLLSLIGTVIAGFMLEADIYIQMYSMPKYELIRLTALMIADIGTYGANVWPTLIGDIFNVIIILAYLAIGLLFSWEFIFKPIKKNVAAESSNDEEYEYVYEDELESDDEVVEADDK